MITIYIGYDPKSVAFIRSRIPSCAARRRDFDRAAGAKPAAQRLPRTRGPTESTEFSLTRFLVPHLSGFSGWSLFMDCDMLCRVDIAELMKQTERQADKAVLVCKHDYIPKTPRKFLDQVQTRYPRKTGRA